MSIDLGDNPQGTPPDESQKAQMRLALGVDGYGITSLLDGYLGSRAWLFGRNFVSDPNNPDPNNYNTYNVESQLTFTFVQSGPFTGASPLYLDFAGYDSNGFPTYTEGGLPIDEFEWSQAMSGFGMYNALRYVLEDQRWVLAHYPLNISTQLSHFYSDVYGDVVAASINLSLWTYTYESTSYMASIQFADVTTGVLPSDHNGQIYQSTPTSPIYLSSVSDVDPVAWLPLVVDASNVKGGAIGYANGGTAATTQRTAIRNLSAFVSIDGSGRTLTTSDIGTTIVATNVGATTFTIPSGLPEHATIKITRRGAGEVTIAAAAGVTIVNTNKRINAIFDTVTIIRIGVNSFVLTGPLKA